MDDTISRLAVIQIIEKMRARIGHNLERSVGRAMIEILDEVGEDVEKLPSALGTNLASLGTDLISRQALLDKFEPWLKVKDYNDGELNMLKAILYEIRFMPPAQPKKGKWIYHIDDLFPAESTMECNQCHAEQPLTCDDEFCPHCGAKMEE